MANLISCLRIVLCITLPFAKGNAGLFYTLYILAGLSDMLDGFVARRTGTVSEFGAKLDSIADMVFAVIYAIVILPEFHLSKLIVIWIVLIALMRLAAVITGIIRLHRTVLPHTIAERITGLMIFVLPLLPDGFISPCGAIIVCAVASIASVREFILIKGGNGSDIR